METIMDALFLVLVVAAPLVGYTWAERRHGTRGQIVLAAALGGALVGVALVVYVVLAALPAAPTPALLAALLPYYVIACAVCGAVIGLWGLLARAVGAWLARRP